jgi:hypothetical protein
MTSLTTRSGITDSDANMSPENITWTPLSSITSNYNRNTVIATFIFIPLCTVTFVLNLLALVLLKRKRRLQESKFYCLLLGLSASDVISSMSCFILVGQVFLHVRNIKLPYICFGATMVISITITFSLIQVLFICLERLLATVSGTNTNKWTGKFSLLYGITLLCTTIYNACVFFSYGDVNSNSCRLRDIFHGSYRKYQFHMTSVQFMLYCSVVTMYSIIIRRLQKRMKQVKVINDELALNTVVTITTRVGNESQEETTSEDHRQPRSKELSEIQYGSESRMIRFKKSILTVGVVILFVSLSSLPCVLTNMISAITNGTVISPQLLEFTNNLIFVNPLLDPIIYVLRIREFRHMLKCKC